MSVMPGPQNKPPHPTAGNTHTALGDGVKTALLQAQGRLPFQSSPRHPLPPSLPLLLLHCLLPPPRAQDCVNYSVGETRTPPRGHWDTSGGTGHGVQQCGITAHSRYLSTLRLKRVWAWSWPVLTSNTCQIPLNTQGTDVKAETFSGTLSARIPWHFVFMVFIFTVSLFYGKG